MTPRPSEKEDELPANASNAPVRSASPVNPNLSATLSADYEALQNDMQQAKDLAADFQRQLAGKSNEFAQLKQLFEKATADLAHLQEGIVELRAERHRFANESMRATAFQAKLAQVTGERDRLRVDLEHVRKALNTGASEMAAAIRDRDAQIAVLVVELVTLKEALEVTRREAAVARPVQVLRAGPSPEAAVPPEPAPEKPTDEVPPVEPSRVFPKRPVRDEMIDISFGR